MYVVGFTRFHCCDRHGIPCSRHGLWPSWFVAIMLYLVAVMVSGSHGLRMSWYIGPLTLTSLNKQIATATVNYRVSKKHVTKIFCQYLCQIRTGFQNSFIGAVCGKFAITQLLNIPPLLSCISTLANETLRKRILKLGQ